MPCRRLGDCLVAGGKSNELQAFPSGLDVVSYVQARHPRITGPAKQTEQLLLQPKAFLALIQFVSSCRVHGAFSPSDTQNFQGEAVAHFSGESCLAGFPVYICSGTDQDSKGTECRTVSKPETAADPPSHYTASTKISQGNKKIAVHFVFPNDSPALARADVIEHALVREGTSELHVAALTALLETGALDVDAFAVRYSQRLEWLKAFIVHTDAEGGPCSARPGCYSCSSIFQLSACILFSLWVCGFVCQLA